MTATLQTTKTPQSVTGVTYRPATHADSRATFEVGLRSLSDLSMRLGLSSGEGEPPDESLEEDWQYYRSLFTHLGNTAAYWWVAERDGQIVGYGYAGVNSGPFAMLDPADLPAVLAHAEGIVAGQGQESFSLAVPLINEAAVGYLLRRGFQMQPFHCRVMTDTPFGHFDHYFNTSPMLFL